MESNCKIPSFRELVRSVLLLFPRLFRFELKLHTYYVLLIKFYEFWRKKIMCKLYQTKCHIKIGSKSVKKSHKIYKLVKISSNIFCLVFDVR